MWHSVHSVLNLIIAMLLFAAGIVALTWPPVRGRILLRISLILLAIVGFSYAALFIGVRHFEPAGDFFQYLDVLYGLLHCSRCVAVILLLVALAMMRSGLPSPSYPFTSQPYPTAPDLGANWPAPPQPPDVGPPDVT